jgi:tRNA threonylcarbamoyladenosine biosynthesis protein TsaE
MNEIILNGVEDTRVFAERVLEFARGLKNESGATVVALHGDLGAGKTTLSQYIGKLLGVKEGMRSPTFVLQKNYETSDFLWKELVHIDAYRIEHPQELNSLKIKDTLAKKDTLILVEWPKQGGDIFKNPHLEVFLEFVDENTRKAKIG